jgi:glycosyltransferase involved in cell wall biosynthesis
MRVLMIVRQFYPWIGGTEKQAQKLAAKLIDLGIHVQVVTGWWQRSTKRKEMVGKIPVTRNFTCWGMLGIKGLRKFGGYVYILSLFLFLWRHRNRYDLIHIQKLSYPAFPGVIAGRLFHKKTIIKIANSGQYSDIRRMRENYLLPGQKMMLSSTLTADKMIAVNNQIISELKEAGVPSKRIVFIPNGVELDLSRCKSDYGLHDPVTIVFIGRLHPQKALDVLLKAFHQVIDIRPNLNWRLSLIGEGSLRKDLEKLSDQLGIKALVKFRGAVDNVSDHLTQADIFVLPSRAEGMSNAMLEAMAYGLPCVASSISANKDLIENGEQGLLVEPGNPSDLAEAITRLAGDDKLRQKCGKMSVKMIKANYELTAIAKKYVQNYQHLLKM